MITLDSVEAFNDACQEVHLLIDYSKRNNKIIKRYATFNKAAVVLLCAKFEAFFEDFLEEYANFHLNISSNHSIDRSIYGHIIDCIVNHLEVIKGKPEKRNEIVNKLETLCGSNEVRPINTFQVDPKLRFGRHGQKEIERLLKAFGFSDYAILDDVKSFFITFNSLLNIRNNIVHEDATPSLTHQTVEQYMKSVKSFVNGLEVVAIEKMKLAS